MNGARQVAVFALAVVLVGLVSAVSGIGCGTRECERRRAARGQHQASTGGETTEPPPEVVTTTPDAEIAAATDAGMPLADAEVVATADGGAVVDDGGMVAEADAAAAEDPEAAQRALARRGRTAFGRACDTCHPGGDEDIGPRIIGKNFTVARMRQQIRQGSGRMRPIPPSRLPDSQMDALMAYLQQIRAVRR